MERQQTGNVQVPVLELRASTTTINVVAMNGTAAMENETKMLYVFCTRKLQT